jgi:hypothetical protein
MKKKPVLLLLLFACLCLQASAQMTEACRAAVKHLTLPSTVESPEMHLAQPLTPLRLIYSTEARDLYLATALQPPYAWIKFTDQPLTLVIVYQDEGARQQAITFLHNMGAGGVLTNPSPPALDNLKFALVNCKAPWKEFVSTGSCSVHDMQYYEPQACIVLPVAHTPAELSRLAMLNARNYRDVINNFNWLNGFEVPPSWPAQKLTFPVAKLKEFAARIQR